jgi:hypothetical protein
LTKNINSVDLLIPFHKVDNFLWKAVESACNSRGVNLHIILLDDREQSKDKDQQILEKIYRHLDSKEIDFTVHRTLSRGYANALNESKLLVKGNFVAILNSDDLISKNRLLIQTNELQNGFDVCICRLKKFSSFLPLPALLGALRFDYCTELLLIGAYGADATFVTTKKLWQTDFVYRTDIPMADWEMALRCYSKYRVSLIPETLYGYRMHRQQVSRTTSETHELPSEFFQSWVLLSQSFGLPVLDRDQVSILATPWNAPRDFSDIRKKQILEWLVKFQTLLDSKSLKSDFVDRRLVLLRLRGFPIRYSVLLAAKMFLEILWLRTLFQGPRVNLKLMAWLRAK